MLRVEPRRENERRADDTRLRLSLATLMRLYVFVSGSYTNESAGSVPSHCSACDDRWGERLPLCPRNEGEEPIRLPFDVWDVTHWRVRAESMMLLCLFDGIAG